jgi:hypothetical protein
MRASPPFTPTTVHERQRAAFGRALAARIRADPSLLVAGQARAACWASDASGTPPRSVVEWLTLCTQQDIAGVLTALEAETEYADEMRASHPFLGVLTDEEVAAIRCSVRAVATP